MGNWHWTKDPLIIESQEWPKISIVTPSFNQGVFLEQTILSVLSQSYPNLEYIIIDGGSTDNSVDIIKKYENQLHFWCSEPDNGHYDAINKGFSKATGEILAWLNSDDLYCPWCLRTVGSVMASLPEVRWLSTLNPMTWDYLGFCSKVHQISGFSPEAFWLGAYLPKQGRHFIGWIQQESTFWRRNLWETAGAKVETNYSLAADFDLWGRFFCQTNLFGINIPLGGFRRQPFQRSKSIEGYLQEASHSLKKLAPSHKEEKKQGIFSNLLRKPQKPKYTGKRIIQQTPESSERSWKIETYSFY